LGNIMALAENPHKLELFLRDGYKNDVKHYRGILDKHGQDPKYQVWLRRYGLVLADYAKRLQLSVQEANDPGTYIRENWPTPMPLMRGYRVREWKSPRGLKHPGRDVPPFLSGTRLEVFEMLYDEWYGGASALSHQRLDAIKAAYFTDEPDQQWQPGKAESNAAIQGMLLAACVLSEIEVIAELPTSIDLRVLWERLEPIHDAARDALTLRYRLLLKL
jgi:hypothetical protein